MAVLSKKKMKNRIYVGNLHFDWSYIESHGNPNSTIDVISFLREPVSRAVSQFYFSKTLPSLRNRKNKNKWHYQTIDEYMNDPESQAIFKSPLKDGMGGTLWLSGACTVKWIAKDSTIETEDRKKTLRENRTELCLRAARRLDEVIWFGLVEDIPTSMKLLQVSMGMNQTPPFPMTNKNKIPQSPPSNETMEKIRNFLPMDTWLYEYATALFTARWKYFMGKTVVYKHPSLPPLPHFD